uniref:Protein FAR1-RELATED SEQUENCE n=1 Tax=Setaria italica TaxID=4555 RepID=K3YLY1_SETIT
MDPNMIPREGMSFHTEAETKAFYMRYAQLAEFGVKMCNKKKFSRVMRCSCEGKGDFYKGDEALQVRNKTTVKTKCKAHLKFTRVYDSEGNEVDMVIEKANLFHNHLLHTPLKTKQMRSHKSTELVLYQIIDKLQEASMSTQSIKNVLQNMHGEHANDINKLIEFFKDCEAQNPQFRWEPKLDFEGVIHSLFWSHASMEGDYADCGDAMSFDTTRKTNIYEKPLAMFVGSNHHLQNTLFGCALLGDETAETFELVFKAFKKCMGQSRTRYILTDQDQAMGMVIAKEFPGVVHKICRWHMVNKHMPQLTNLFGMYVKKNFKDKFYSVLNHPLTPVEFEAAWQELLDEFDLQKDSTLDSLYCQRALYVPTYFKDQYCGKMALTQRSESSNFSKRLTKSKWPFEIQVSRTYTRNVFNDFEKKMIDCMAFDIEDNPIEGLFYVHLLRAFMRIQLNKIPEHYILRRYTKYAQQELGFNRNDKLLVGADGVTQLYRIKDLMSLAMAAVRFGSMSSAAHIRTREVLAMLDKDNKEIPPDIGPSSRSRRQEAPGE